MFAQQPDPHALLVRRRTTRPLPPLIFSNLPIVMSGNGYEALVSCLGALRQRLIHRSLLVPVPVMTRADRLTTYSRPKHADEMPHAPREPA